MTVGDFILRTFLGTGCFFKMKDKVIITFEKLGDQKFIVRIEGGNEDLQAAITQLAVKLNDILDHIPL